MSRILAIMFAVLTFALPVHAKETVTIVYSFSPADSMANYGRTMADEANKAQNKYNFVFDTKPGAGSTIAANYVLNNSNTILLSSAAFFLRPNLYPKDSHDLSKFKILLPVCSAPMAIGATKYKTWKDIPKDGRLTIGTSGLGVVSHLTALQVATKYPNTVSVPFKSTTDSGVALVSNTVDLHVSFLGEMEDLNSSKHPVYVLGSTGSKVVNGHPTLVSQGFPQALADMNNPHHLSIPATIPNEKAREWRDILVVAAKQPSVRAAYAVDHCESLDQMPVDQAQAWWNYEIELWRKLGTGVKLD